jgi:CxxC motif-containing protein
MTEMICIVCPRGCHLSVGEAPEFTVSGNNCPRGERYGREELIAPKRTVTATCPATKVASRTPSANEPLSKPRRVPVRTTGPVPREKIGDLVSLLMRTQVTLPVHEGDVIIENWEGTGISVIVTRTLTI